MGMQHASPIEEEDMLPLAAPVAHVAAETLGATYALASMVSAAPGQPQARSAGPGRLPGAALVAHLVEQHHAYARRVLPYIVPLLAKVAGFFGGRYQKLNALCDAGQELAEALESHLDEGERDLFPALLDVPPARDTLRRALERMLGRHLELQVLLARVRSLADGYDHPIRVGRSYEVLVEELEALEENVVEHMHLESHVVVPRLFSLAREVA